LGSNGSRRDLARRCTLHLYAYLRHCPGWSGHPITIGRGQPHTPYDSCLRVTSAATAGRRLRFSHSRTPRAVFAGRHARHQVVERVGHTLGPGPRHVRTWVPGSPHHGTVCSRACPSRSAVPARSAVSRVCARRPPHSGRPSSTASSSRRDGPVGVACPVSVSGTGYEVRRTVGPRLTRRRHSIFDTWLVHMGLDGGGGGGGGRRVAGGGGGGGGSDQPARAVIGRDVRLRGNGVGSILRQFHGPSPSQRAPSVVPHHHSPTIVAALDLVRQFVRRSYRRS